MYPRVFGKYILERELARGGMARVVLATLRGAGGFEKRLVVKQIRDELAFDDDFTRRFVEEAKTTVALSHPNIVPVYELGVEQGVYFLAMELVEGASLAELIGKGEKLSPDEGAYVGVEVCRALDYAHRKMQVVHRDITPRNVMIDEEGQVKIIDFGIAGRVLDLGLGNARVFGSPGHMHPSRCAEIRSAPPQTCSPWALSCWRRGQASRRSVARRSKTLRPHSPRLTRGRATPIHASCRSTT